MKRVRTFDFICPVSPSLLAFPCARRVQCANALYAMYSNSSSMDACVCVNANGCTFGQKNEIRMKCRKLARMTHTIVIGKQPPFFSSYWHSMWHKSNAFTHMVNWAQWTGCCSSIFFFILYVYLYIFIDIFIWRSIKYARQTLTYSIRVLLSLLPQTIRRFAGRCTCHWQLQKLHFNCHIAFREVAMKNAKIACNQTCAKWNWD